MSCVYDVLIADACRAGRHPHACSGQVGGCCSGPNLEKRARSLRIRPTGFGTAFWRNCTRFSKSADGRLSAVKLRLEERVMQELPTVVVLETLTIPVRARHDMLTRASKAIFAAASDPGISEEERKRLYELRTSMKAVIIKLKAEIGTTPTEVDK